MEHQFENEKKPTTENGPVRSRTRRRLFPTERGRTTQNSRLRGEGAPAAAVRWGKNKEIDKKGLRLDSYSRQQGGGGECCG